jgi:catechol 2,3-dioxygenase-like lactoylglutathione lyase family enzyme
MAIIGAHALLYSPDPDGLRATLREVFGWEHVDDGGGWLIFKLPPAELGVHPSDGPTNHALSLMCDDIEATMTDLRAKGVTFTHEPRDEGYGVVTVMELPGGVRMQLYQPRHQTVV